LSILLLKWNKQTQPIIGEIMLPETLEKRKMPVTLVHHAACCRHQAPPGSLSALEQCLKNGATHIEIDIIPLADGSFALLHDQHLEVETSGQGRAPAMQRGQVENLYYKLGDQVTGEKVGFLEAAIELLIAHPETKCLQLDLKPFTPLTRGVLRGFLELLEPVKDRIQVTSVSDWAVRSLARFAPDLALGFDPLLYLDLEEGDPRPPEVPPFRIGAYGLRDDHPLSAYQWGPLGDYFAARAGALLVQAPKGCEWFIRAELLKMAHDAGFNWIDFLHQNGAQVDGWTIDVTQPKQVELAQFLVARGVDKLTTDTPARLAEKLLAKSNY
jgi:glycerophosphoryl diester phosphodiesterase